MGICGVRPHIGIVAVAILFFKIFVGYSWSDHSGVSRLVMESVCDVTFALPRVDVVFVMGVSGLSAVK